MEQLVRRMDLEARSVGGNDAKQMKILRDCKAKAQELKAKAREAKERRAQTDSRAQLFASSSGGGGGGTGPAMLSSSNSGGEQDRRREQNSGVGFDDEEHGADRTDGRTHTGIEREIN